MKNSFLEGDFWHGFFSKFWARSRLYQRNPKCSALPPPRLFYGLRNVCDSNPARLRIEGIGGHRAEEKKL